MSSTIQISIGSSNKGYYSVDGEGHIQSLPSQQCQDQIVIQAGDPASSTERVANIAAATMSNLEILLDRGSKTIFTASDGQLKRISSWDLFGRFWYWLDRDNQRARVKQIISDSFGALEAALKSLNLNKTSRAGQALTDHLNSSLFSRFTTIRNDVFDRSIVKPNGELEAYFTANHLKLDVVKRREALKTAMKTKEGVKEAFYQLAHAEETFSKELGLTFKLIISGGSGGARRGFSRTAKPIVAIKPEDEGPYGVNNTSFSSRIKRIFLSPRACIAGGADQRAEEMSYRTSELFKWNNVPPTHVESVDSASFNVLNKKECSVQLWLAGAKPLEAYLQQPWLFNKVIRFAPRCCRSWFRSYLEKRKESIPQLPQALFEQSLLLKYLTGDIDSHFENMLIKTASPENEFIGKYRAGIATPEEVNFFVDHIFEEDRFDLLLEHLFASDGDTILVNHDGGASFPNQHPATCGLDAYLSGRFRFLFEVLPQCNQPFVQEVGEDYLAKGDERLLKLISEMAMQELIGVIGINTKVFVAFWAVKENRKRFRQFLLKPQLDNRTLVKLRSRLVGFTEVHNPSHSNFYAKKYQRELVRIRGMVQTLANRHRVAMAHFQDGDKTIRDLLSHVDRNEFEMAVSEIPESDFDRELARLAESETSEDSATLAGIQTEGQDDEKVYNQLYTHIPGFADEFLSTD